MLELLLVILLVLATTGGSWGWYRRADYGPYPVGAAGLVLVVLFVVLILRVI